MHDPAGLGQSLPCKVSFPTENKKILQSRKEKMKNIFKSNAFPSPLHFPDAEQSWKKGEKGDNLFRDANESPVPSSREAGQAGTCGTAVTRDLHGHQGATTRCRENMC